MCIRDRFWGASGLASGKNLLGRESEEILGSLVLSILTPIMKLMVKFRD